MAGHILKTAEQEGGLPRVAADRRERVWPALCGPGYDKMPPQLPVQEAYGDAARIVNALLDFRGELSGRCRAAGLLPVHWAECLLARALRAMRLNYNALLGVLMCTVEGRLRQAHSVQAAILSMLAACQWGLPARSARDLGLQALFCDWDRPDLAAETAAPHGRAAGKAAAGAHRPPSAQGREPGACYPGGAQSGQDKQTGKHEQSGTQEQARGRGGCAGTSPAGAKLALPADIPAIARRYAALISFMPGAEPLSPHQALARMRARVDSAFDPEALEHFIRCLGLYPVGGVVETQAGQRGLVIENTPDAPHLLTVRLLRPAGQGAAFGPAPAQSWQARQIAKAYPLSPPPQHA